jgi:hypothetical protein
LLPQVSSRVILLNCCHKSWVSELCPIFFVLNTSFTKVTHYERDN